MTQHAENEVEWTEHLPIKTLLKITLIKASLSLQGLEEIYWIFFFCSIVKLIYKLWHKVFINLWLIPGLWHSFIKICILWQPVLPNLWSAIGKPKTSEKKKKKDPRKSVGI